MVVALIVVAIGLVVLGTFAYTRFMRSGLAVQVAGEVVPVETLVSNLSNEDRDIVMSSLHFLTERRESAGAEEAKGLLSNDDDYIWFNAALYLGAIGDAEAIPYLIKGLKHPASRAYPEVARDLETLTGERFGTDQERWLAWWRSENPSSDFGFSYARIEQQTLALDSRSNILINRVADPTTISYSGSGISLIGIRLKAEADREEAVSLLKTAVLAQYVQLAFDTGPKLDSNGNRRALVYWTRGSDKTLSSIMRRGLGKVPFSSKTLVNAYLLRSGLYEADPESVSEEDLMEMIAGDGVSETPGEQGS